MLITKEHEQVSFSFDGKLFNNDDLDFISSVNDENIGIVVAKRKLYYFNGKDQTLSPVFARKDELNIKNQAKLEEDLPLCFSNESDSVSVLSARCGKSERIRIRFNSLLVPISISLADGDFFFLKNSKAKRSYESPLRMNTEGNKTSFSKYRKKIPTNPDFYAEQIYPEKM